MSNLFGHKFKSFHLDSLSFLKGTHMIDPSTNKIQEWKGKIAN